MIMDVSPWPSQRAQTESEQLIASQTCSLNSQGGALVLDEGIQVARAICNSNANSVLLVLQPMVGAVAAQSAVMKNRRDLEDKLMSHLASKHSS